MPRTSAPRLGPPIPMLLTQSMLLRMSPILAMHVDATYTDTACIYPKYKHHLNGGERVDSITLVHKNGSRLAWTTCACGWAIRIGSQMLLRQTQSTIRMTPTSPEPWLTPRTCRLGWAANFGVLTPKLWMLIRAYGAAKLQDNIRNNNVAMAMMCNECVRANDWFEVVVPSNFAHVNFKIKRQNTLTEDDADVANHKLMERLIRTAYIPGAHDRRWEVRT